MILLLTTRIPLLWLGEVGGREKVFKQVRRDNTWWVVLFSCALQKHGALADIVKRKATKKLTRWGEDSGDSKGAQKTTVQNAGETQRHRRYLQVPRGGYPQVPRGTQVPRCWRPGVPPGQRGKQGSYLAGDGLLPLGAQLSREVGGDPCCTHHWQHNLAVGRENVTCLQKRKLSSEKSWRNKLLWGHLASLSWRGSRAYCCSTICTNLPGRKIPAARLT